MKTFSGPMRPTLLVALAVLALLLPVQGIAGSFDTYVGYADNLRASPFFPNPFFGDPSVALFAGQNPNTTQLDAGAVMIHNSGATSIVINAISVVINPTAGPQTFTLWNTVLPFTLAAGQNAIFTQTTQFNFDTSDFPIVGQNILNNCSVGALASSSTCINNAPLVNVTIDGTLFNLKDTGHVLNTGGFDANCCLPNGNESLQWRLIGTTGVQDPGGVGSVPEPASLLLMGSGLAGLAAWRIRRNT